MQEPLLVLTVDVEPDWGVSGSEAVLQTLPRLLELLDRHRAQATFFVVADLLDACREPLRSAAGPHEIASHGLSHSLLDRLPVAEVKRELAVSRARLSVQLDTQIIGFRAPFLRPAPGWPRLLAEAGYAYDSSWGRVHPSVRNVPPGRWGPFAQGPVVEIPTTTLRTGLVPLSLTYLRLCAPWAERLLPRTAAIVYLHLHELADPALTRKLRPPLRWLLRRNVGAPAWGILGRLLQRWRGRTVSCRTLLERSGLLMGRGES